MTVLPATQVCHWSKDPSSVSSRMDGVQVLLDKASIDRQKAQLQTENDELSEALQQFMDGISVPAAAMDDPQNTLLMVKQIGKAVPQARGSNKGKASMFGKAGPARPSQNLTASQAVAV